VNPRRRLRLQTASLAGNAALFILVITADFYGWIPGWASFLGLAISAGWLYLNHLLPRSWYGWLKRLATGLGWDAVLASELMQDAASARMAGRWDQAAPSLEGAAVAAARHGDAVTATSCLTDAAAGYAIIDDFAKARRCRDAAADLANVVADEGAKRRIRWINGLIAWYSGERSEAHRLLEAFAAHEAGADPLRAGVSVLALAQMDSDEGHHEQGLARLTTFAADGLESPRMSVLGLILLRSGRFKSARLALERARSTRPLAHRSANALAEESLTLALLDLAEGNPAPAHQALLATAERHSHDIRMLQGDLLTALGGIEERQGSPDRARELLTAALKAYEGIAPANAASLRHHLDPSSPAPPSTDSDGDPLALYYAWPPPAAAEGDGGLPSSPIAPLVDRRSRGRISPNTVASIVTAAVTLLFFLPLGWPAAVGLLGLLAIHEFGHYFGAKLVGVQARTPIFLGLLGAATIIDRKPGDVRRDSIITLGGPAVGLAVAAICLVASLVTQSSLHTILVALARGGFFLNLLQLVPILPLDGGHVAKALHRNWLIAGVVLQIAILVVVLRSPTPSVTAVAFVLATMGATVWMFFRPQQPRPAERGRGLVAAAYVATVAIAAGGLVAGFVVPFRAPAHLVGSRVVGDGFSASVPDGWEVEPTCCDELLALIHSDPSGARAGISVLDLRGSGFGFAFPLAGSPMAIAQGDLAADLRRADATTVRDVTPLGVPGLDGVEFTYSCSCDGGYPGEEFTSDVVILEHGDQMLSITLGTFTQEYRSDHASLDDLLGGWSWTTAN
jgi:Zn-dependent protease